jgi:hypothetical protein
MYLGQETSEIPSNDFISTLRTVGHTLSPIDVDTGKLNPMKIATWTVFLLAIRMLKTGKAGF